MKIQNWACRFILLALCASLICSLCERGVCGVLSKWTDKIISKCFTNHGRDREETQIHIFMHEMGWKTLQHRRKSVMSTFSHKFDNFLLLSKEGKTRLDKAV